MSNYSDNPAMVRVDFFKPRGKWYTTEAVEFTGHESTCIATSLKQSLKKHLDGRMSGMIAVCLHPYHKNAHPVMVIVE